MNPWIRSTLAIALLAAPMLLGACRATRTEALGEPLPFHVAILPPEIKEPTKSEAKMQLQVESQGVVQAMAAGLREHGFARVTVLEPDAQEPALSSNERARHWQERAHELGADLLLRTTLSYDPSIETNTNDRFWLNLPLFLLGGPMCWFVDDRSYKVSARLQADFFDVSDVHDELAQWTLLPLPLYVEFNETDLDFIDRADGGTDYALSLLIPAGLVARSSDRVARKVEQAFLNDLSQELSAKVQAERARFDQNTTLWAFRIDGSGAHAVRNRDGSVSVVVPVQGVGQNTSPYRFEIRAQEGEFKEQALGEGEFGAAEADGRLWIRESVAMEAGAQYVTIRVEDERNRARSYTLPIQGADAEVRH